MLVYRVRVGIKGGISYLVGIKAKNKIFFKKRKRRSLGPTHPQKEEREKTKPKRIERKRRRQYSI
jgi:hypothetical protein